MILYKYGMRLRGCSLGAQPRGFIKFDESNKKYWNVLYYDRKLDDKDIEHYSLDYLGTEEDC